jgi:hypothetical protein
MFYGSQEINGGKLATQRSKEENAIKDYSSQMGFKTETSMHKSDILVLCKLSR